MITIKAEHAETTIKIDEVTLEEMKTTMKLLEYQSTINKELDKFDGDPSKAIAAAEKKMSGMTIKDVARHKDYVKLEKRVKDLEWTVGKLKEIIHHSDIKIDTRKVSFRRDDDDAISINPTLVR